MADESLRPSALSLFPRARPRKEMQMMEVPLQLRVSGSYLLETLQSVCVIEGGKGGGGAGLSAIAVF